MTDKLTPDVDWFDSAFSWERAMATAVFFARYSRVRLVVRWMPQYHKWYVGFRKPQPNPLADVYAGIRESIARAGAR